MILSTFTIVCSNQARNGKTLLGSLYGDYLIHTGRDVWVFDLDGPGGNIASNFAGRSSIIDLSQTRNVMELFDTVVSTPPGNYVVDLPHHQVDRFLALIDDIGFVETAERAGIAITVLFLCDFSFASIVSARTIRSHFSDASFIIVRNEGIPGPKMDAELAWAFDGFSKSGFFVIPRMVSSTLECMVNKTYTFGAFLDAKTPATQREKYYTAHVFFTTIRKEFEQLEANLDLDNFKRDLDRWKSSAV